MQAHIDASGDSGRTYDAAVVHDPLVGANFRPGSALAQKIERSMMRRRCQSIQHARPAQHQGAGANRQHQLGLTGDGTDPLNQRQIVDFATRPLPTRDQKDVWNWTVSKIHMRIDAQTILGQDRARLLGDSQHLKRGSCAEIIGD